MSALAWEQPQRAGVRAQYERELIRGKVCAIDGSGLGPELRLVSPVCVSAVPPVAGARALVCRRAWPSGLAAYQAYPRAGMSRTTRSAN